MTTQLDHGTFEAMIRQYKKEAPPVVKVREETRDLVIARQARIDGLLRQLDREMRRSCVSCDYFHAGGICEKQQGAQVPEWFAPFGCDEWQEEVPF